MKNFIILIFFLVILIAPTSVLSKNLTECTWKNKDGVPCVTIRTPNSNSISDKILPSFIINKKKIEDNNLIDLTSVLNFVNGINYADSTRPNFGFFFLFILYCLFLYMRKVEKYIIYFFCK